MSYSKFSERGDRTCAACANHGESRRLKGHKRRCPFLDCTCSRCVGTRERRLVMARDVAARRHRVEDQTTSELKSPRVLGGSSPTHRDYNGDELEQHRSTGHVTYQVLQGPVSPSPHKPHHPRFAPDQTSIYKLYHHQATEIHSDPKPDQHENVPEPPPFHKPYHPPRPPEDASDHTHNKVLYPVCDIRSVPDTLVSPVHAAADTSYSSGTITGVHRGVDDEAQWYEENKKLKEQINAQKHTISDLEERVADLYRVLQVETRMIRSLADAKQALEDDISMLEIKNKTLLNEKKILQDEKLSIQNELEKRQLLFRKYNKNLSA